MNNQKIDAFIDYNYVPFSKSQCVKRTILIWIFSAPVCFIGRPFVPWAIVLGIMDLAVSAFFIALIVKYPLLKTSRFLCDGVFCLDVSILLNFASYRVMALHDGESWLRMIILLLLLPICIFAFLPVVFHNIKADIFNPANAAKNKPIGPLPYLAGGLGVLTARIFLQGQSEQVGLKFVAFVILLLSLSMGIGSLQLLRYLLFKRQNKG